MGGSNQSLFLIGALIAAQGSAAVPLLVLGLMLSWAALPGWTELILMWPDRVGGIAASCSEAFKPYSPVLANLAGTCYWWGWVPTCGLTALLSAAALHQWYLPAIPVKVLAAAIVAIFALANLVGLRRVTRLAVVLAGCSAALAFLSAVLPVVAGHVRWQQASSFHLVVPFGGLFGHFTSAMAGLYLVGFAAPAFEAAACHVGETIDPNRNIPRAMYASAGMATLYFLVLPVVWLGMFGPTPLTKDLTDMLGPTFAPLFGGMAKAAAVWFMVLNMFHGTLTPVTGAARTLSQLSEDGLLPRVLARRSRRDVPWVASALTAGMAIAFLLGGDPVWVIAAANFTYLISISLPSVAVWLLRKKQPHLTRPYRAPRGTIGLGLVAAVAWGIATVFGFEQFGLPTVLAGLALAYSGAAAYAFRRWQDRNGRPRLVKRSLHLKLTGAMVAVLALDGIGYLLAVGHVANTDPSLVAGLKDIFVAVAMLTVSVGLLLPGMISHAAGEVAVAADRLAKGTLADLTRAMRALAAGDFEDARARVETRHIAIVSADEVGALAASFNVIIDETARIAESLDDARDALQANRRDLEALVTERTAHAAMQAAVAKLGRAAVASSDVALICDQAVSTVAATLHADRAGFVDYRPSDRTLGLVHSYAPDGADLRPRLSGSDGSNWWSALSAASPVMLEYADCDQLFGHQPGQGHGLWATVAVRHEPFGSVVCVRDDPQLPFTADDVSFLGAVANIVGSAVSRIRNEEELNHQALHDPLTGLPNRVLLVDRLALGLARLHRRPGTLAVLFVDVDQFKVINDSLGHDQGDRLLILMAERLRSAVRPGDTVARFGGDEFVVLCEDLAGQNEAIAIGERIREQAATPLLLDGRDYFVTVSTGIALTDSPDMPAADLLRDADSAMYQAKQTGRARSAVFAQSMRTRAVRRLDTELALRQAIAEGQLRVHYQPIVNLTTGRIDGVEALVRWEHPTNGMIMPDEFIPIAEETGLIVPLGEWVLGQSCRQTQAWRTEHPQLSRLGVSVNLSGRQIAQSDLITVVANVLSDTGLPPDRLVLEITESVLMADAEAAITVLRGLKSLGVRLSVDDFGTGYSSLSYLKKFPVDILKIDRSFIDGLGVEDDDSAIVQATINLAHSLGLTTVAEGTETPAQVRALTDLGCDKAQGYLFSRPLPALALLETLLLSPVHRP
jgi:diguanylate cyclase (GGDEF)-like protein